MPIYARAREPSWLHIGRETLGREVTTIEDNLAAPDSEEAISTAPQRVHAVLEMLPDNYRRILELRFLQGYSVR